MLQRGLSPRRRPCGKGPGTGPRPHWVPSASDSGWAMTEQSHWRGGMRSPPPWPLGHLCPLLLVPRPSLWDGDLDDTARLCKVPTPNSTAWTVPRTLSQPAAKSPARLGPAHEQTGATAWPRGRSQKHYLSLSDGGEAASNQPVIGSRFNHQNLVQSPLTQRGPWPHSCKQCQIFVA